MLQPFLKRLEIRFIFQFRLLQQCLHFLGIMYFYISVVCESQKRIQFRQDRLVILGKSCIMLPISILILIVLIMIILMKMYKYPSYFLHTLVFRQSHFSIFLNQLHFYSESPQCKLGWKFNLGPSWHLQSVRQLRPQVFMR